MTIQIPKWFDQLNRARFGLIGNTNAGPSHKEKNITERWLIEVFSRQMNNLIKEEFDYDDFITHMFTNDVRDLSKTLIKLINEKEIKLLFVFGGDGSLHLVIDILLYEYHEAKRIKYLPIIASIGGGTMLAVHSWLGWEQRPFEIFKKIIFEDTETWAIRRIRPLAIVFTPRKEKLKSGEISAKKEVVIEKTADNDSEKKADAVNGKIKNELVKRFGFMFIMGAITRVIQLYDSDKSSRSLTSGIKHFFAGMSGSILGWPESHKKVTSNFEADVYVNGRILPHANPMSIICCKNDSIMFGNKPYSIKPFAGCAASNQFYFMSTSFSATQISMMVPLLYKGTFNPKIDSFVNMPVTNITIIPKEEGVFFLDGEFYFCEPGEDINIKTAPLIDLVQSF